MKTFLIKRPMLLSGIACIIISVVGFYSFKALAIIGISVLAALTIAILKKSNLKVYLCFAVIIVMLLSVSSERVKTENFKKLKPEEHTFKTVVTEIVGESDKYHFAVFEIFDSGKPFENQKINGTYSPCELEMGDAVEITLTLSPVSQDEYTAQNYAEGIYFEGFIYDINHLEQDDFVLKTVGKSREYIKETLFSNMNYSEASTLCALVFGDKSYFTADFENNVKRAGVSHVMVVSGMHLSILVALALGITEKRCYNRYLKAAAIVAVVFSVMALCGFTMSVLRAGVTYLIMAAGILAKKDNSSANTLGTAIVIILILSPFAILSLALQLSLLSTFGIIAVAIPVIRYTESRRIIKSKIGVYLFSSAVITFFAMILTLPVIIYHFGYVSIVGIITNVFISYAVTISLSLTVAGLILNLFSNLAATFVFTICELIVKYINSVINFFGSLEFAAVSLPQRYSIYAIIGIILIFYVLLACKKRIDMIKLKEMNQKVLKESGKRKKWR